MDNSRGSRNGRFRSVDRRPGLDRSEWKPETGNRGRVDVSAVMLMPPTTKTLRMVFF